MWQSLLPPVAAVSAMLFVGATVLAGDPGRPRGEERHLLYVAVPGIRNELRYGGAGILVFDVDRGHAFVKRIETPASRLPKPENIKGICANAKTQRLYFTTLSRLYCLDLQTDKTLWEKTLAGGCDRMSMTPDGHLLYVPSLEGPHWNVVDGATGALVTQISTGSGSHNTICSLDGSRVYLAGLRSPLLTVADAHSRKVLGTVGPFSAAIRPFTVNASNTRCYVNVNGLLGFEVGDITTDKMLHRVTVQDFRQGPVLRHGCPSHGIGLTPDEKEIWLCDAANRCLHIFDATVTPPRQTAHVKLRDEPGWVTFGLDGRFAYPSTGEVVDTKSKKIVTALQDEQGREVHSEKLLEIAFQGDRAVQAGDQFGLGRAGVVTDAGSKRRSD
jgi:DNA-binding beta-propeller fold protein YncE